MSDEIKVKITDPAHVAKITEWYGALQVRAALADVKEFQKLPGFGLAMAIVERETATMQAAAVADNLKAIARAGHDITTIAGINLEFERGRPVLSIRPMDLADMAEEQSS